MVSYQLRSCYEEFFVYGTKLAVIAKPDGHVVLQVHVPKGSHASARKSDQKFYWQATSPLATTADELRALAGV